MKEPTTMGEVRQAYIDNMLLGAIRKIADLEYQWKAWVEGSIPNVIDSWDETVCQFFDDADVDDTLKNLDLKFEFSNNQIKALWKFRNIFDEYILSISNNLSRDRDPRKIIQDPVWHEVVKVAQETLKVFKGYRVPPDSEPC